MTQDWTLERIKTIRNLSEVALIIHASENLLPTILEILLVECQELVGETCVIKDGVDDG